MRFLSASEANKESNGKGHQRMIRQQLKTIYRHIKYATKCGETSIEFDDIYPEVKQSLIDKGYKIEIIESCFLFVPNSYCISWGNAKC